MLEPIIRLALLEEISERFVSREMALVGRDPKDRALLSIDRTRLEATVNDYWAHLPAWKDHFRVQDNIDRDKVGALTALYLLKHCPIVIVCPTPQLTIGPLVNEIHAFRVATGRVGKDLSVPSGVLIEAFSQFQRAKHLWVDRPEDDVWKTMFAHSTATHLCLFENTRGPQF